MKCFLVLAPLFIYVSGSVAKDNVKQLTLVFVERQALDSSYKAKMVNAELEAVESWGGAISIDTKFGVGTKILIAIPIYESKMVLDSKRHYSIQEPLSISQL
jgi:hypothetical protein